MNSVLLLVNAGSSSLKLSLCDSASGEPLAAALVDWSSANTVLTLEKDGEKDRRPVTFKGALEAFKGALPEISKQLPHGSKIEAIGHRVVHGGDLAEGQVITDKVLETLHNLTALAPLHNPPSLAAIYAAKEIYPDIPHVAVFDTAFHRTMRPEAAQYAVPPQWSGEWKIKRYGFHGLSYSYCAGRAAELLNRPLEELRLIVCHLGHGCSVCAISGGSSVDTTMGFTPLEGLMMATRSGNIDVGAVLYAQDAHKLGASELSAILNSQSGLLGVSGVSADMRQVMAAADQGDSNAKLAIDMFCYRIQQAIGSLLVSLGGVDALVFTAGIGENSALIREQICRGLSFLGFELDQGKNGSAAIDTDVAAAQSPSRILVIAAREDISMLQEVRRAVSMCS
ncbi:MAG: acetate kinase [Proteobacteria bacterium]|nr:MAG: acetate kinase [Pseudomonadota bacterium]